MTGSKKTLRDALKDIQAEHILSPGEHPEIEEMADLKDGLLPQEQAEKLNIHIAHCDQCMAEWEQLDTAPEGIADEPLRSGTELREAWQEFENNVLDKPNTPDTPAPVIIFPRLPWLIAAALLVACLGLGFLVSDLKKQINTPVANVIIADLIPRNTRSNETLELNLQDNATHLVLRLNTVETTPRQHYSVHIKGEQQSRELKGVTQHPGGFFTVSVPVAMLTENRYQIVLEGRDHGQTQVLAEYYLQLNR